METEIGVQAGFVDDQSDPESPRVGEQSKGEGEERARKRVMTEAIEIEGRDEFRATPIQDLTEPSL
jgi:hypothetical protein